MPILYSAVAYKRRVLHRHACCDGNFDEVLSDVINKVPTDDHRVTYYHKRHLLHVVMESEHFYFCVTDKLCQRSRAFLFLKEIKRRFCSDKCGFRDTLADLMTYYNDDGNAISIDSGDIDEINAIRVDSSESVLGETILLVRSEHCLEYPSVSRVDKKPETAVTSSGNNKHYVKIIATTFIVISLLVVKPLLVVVVFAILYSIVR